MTTVLLERPVEQGTRSSVWKGLSRYCAWLLVLTSAVLIVHTWTIYDQTGDENDHIAGGMEWLANHTFSIDAVDPPLPPVMVALGPSALGLKQRVSGDPWKSGNEILACGNYHHVLYAARAGTMVFFLFAAYLVWSAGREVLGEWGACLALGLFGLLPEVMAHSSLATTDASMFAMLFWALDRLWRLLDRRTVKNALLAGVSAALAMVSKMTALPCILLALICFAVLRWHRARRGEEMIHPRPWSRILLSFVTCCIVVWGMYFFTVGSIAPPGSEDRAKLTVLMERHHLPPSPVLTVLTHLPAPEFFAGLRAARAIGKNSGHYWLLGKNRTHATRMFFPVIFAAKMPIPFTVLFLAGFALAARMVWRSDGSPYREVFLTGAFVPFGFGVLSGVNLGSRHILGMVPFAALLAAVAAQWMWRTGAVQRGTVIVLLAWFAVDAAWAARDPLPWYNEVAQQMPHGGAWFEPGSDFDWGQDLKRVPAMLAQDHVQRFSFAYNGSADLSRAGLPAYTLLQPGEHARGWVVASAAMLMTGRSAFGWINAYKPVARAGQTIWLYWIPAANGPASAGRVEISR